MAAERNFRPPKQWKLKEEETITSFSSWLSNIEYHLSLNNEFARFLTSEWSKKSVMNRGLQPDTEAVVSVAADRKTNVQKNLILEQMLNLIAQFAPSLLGKDIVKNSTSLKCIWQRIRRYYAFSQSECNFLKLSLIQREPNERYETLFQRIVAHLDDNLLTVSSGIEHDGAVLTVDEDMSPTTERLAVYIWLTTIDSRLPLYVSRVYAHELQKKSLNDFQPQLSESMDSILQAIATQEEITIQYSSTNDRPRRFPHRYPPRSKKLPFSAQQPASTKSKCCVICKAANRPCQGHDINNCWYISKFEKLQVAKALQVAVDDDDDDDDVDEELENAMLTAQISTTLPSKSVGTTIEVKKVQCDASPYFYAFYEHHPCHVVVDTGATSSLISKSFLTVAGIKMKPTRHSARTVDKSPIGVQGEVHIILNYGDKKSPCYCSGHGQIGL